MPKKTFQKRPVDTGIPEVRRGLLIPVFRKLEHLPQKVNIA
jgi:hypothetical protein